MREIKSFVHVASPAPGEVMVTILSHEGRGEAAPDLLDLVAERLSADEVRPLTDPIQVQSALVRPITLDAVIEVHDGPDPNIVIAEGERRAWDYLRGQHVLGGVFAQERPPCRLPYRGGTPGGPTSAGWGCRGGADRSPVAGGSLLCANVPSQIEEIRSEFAYFCANVPSRIKEIRSEFAGSVSWTHG